MPIKIKHGKPETALTLAAQIGQARTEARRTEALEQMQLDFDYKKALREQDMAIDLEAEQRAKLWQIEKMELASRADFMREEQARQRKLDGLDSAIQQLDKEVQAGRMTEEEAYPYKLKLELAKSGVNVPIEDIRGDEDGRFGVAPHWMRGEDAPIGSPERNLYEAEMKRRIEGRTGTVPWDLAPDNISTPMARASREAREMYIEDFMDAGEKMEYEISGIVPTRFQGAETTGALLADKSLDIGVRTEGVTPGLPTITSDAEYDALPSGTEFIDQNGKRWRKP